MKKSVILRQQRDAKLQAQKTIYELAAQEKRGVTADEEQQLNDLDVEVDALAGEIDKAEKHEERLARIAAQNLPIATGADGGDSEEREMGKMAKRFSFLAATRGVTGNGKLEGVEKELNDEAVREAQALNLKFDTSERAFSIPAKMVRAAGHTVTEDNGKFGGKLVPTDISVVEGFIPRLFLEEAGASVLTGLVGDLSLPKFSDYDYKWLAEREAIKLEAEDIDGPVLRPRRAGAGVSISSQLIAQTSVGVENILYNKLREAAARALNKAALNGDGVKAPLGILNMTGVQLAKATAEQIVSHEAIVELWGLIAGANADTGNEVFILNSKLAAALKTTKKDAGSGRFLMENGLIDGGKTIITNLVEELAGLQTLIYGNFSELYIGQWGGVNFVADSITGAGSGEVKIFSNLYADIQSANQNAFAVNKFLKG